MDVEMMEMMVESRCPFAKGNHMRVAEVGEDGTFTMVMEASQDNLNAFGLVHAGAICGLVETCGGMGIFYYLDPRDFIVLNTILNIRFSSMPTGELTCSARVTGDEVLSMLEDYRLTGKADKAMDLKVTDASGKVVAQAQATFRLMETPEEFKPYFSEAFSG